MGAIMCIGVATANSILLVTTADDVRVKDTTLPRRPIRWVHAYPSSDHDGACHDYRIDFHGPGDR